MKIALVLETSGGGSGRHVLDIAEVFGTMGHTVSVFWSPVRAESSFVERLQNLPGVTAIEVALHRSVGVHDIRGYFDLRRALTDAGPFDVVHAHSSKAGALVRLMPRSIAPVRIYTPHALRTMDPEISGKAAFLYGRIERLLARRRDRLIAVSFAERRHAVKLGIPRGQVSVVPNGATPVTRMDRDTARAALGVAPDDYVVGFVGRLVAQKDPLRFVAAIRDARTRIPNLRAVVMGDGELMDEAKALAGDGPVTFLGWCDAPALVSGLDTLCVTSRYEALAYSFLEALHAGVPIVSAAVGGVEETVVNGETGIVLPVDAAPAAFSDALERLANPARRAAFSAASAPLAVQRTTEAMAEATLEVYRRAGADARAMAPVLGSIAATSERPR